VALGWVAAGFLFDLGVTFDWVEVELMAKLGGWDPRQNRAPAGPGTALGDAGDTGHALELCHRTSGPSAQDRCFLTRLATSRDL
jgi:hypothetical protein